MADQYASIIIDISHEDVDRVFQYRIPPALLPEIRVGVQVSSLLVQETEHETAMWWNSPIDRIMIKRK